MKLEWCTTSCIYMALGAGCWAQALLVIISRNDSETCDELAAQKSEEGLHDSSDSSKCNENKGTHNFLKTILPS